MNEQTDKEKRKKRIVSKRKFKNNKKDKKVLSKKRRGTEGRVKWKTLNDYEDWEEDNEAVNNRI